MGCRAWWPPDDGHGNAQNEERRESGFGAEHHDLPKGIAQRGYAWHCDTIALKAQPLGNGAFVYLGELEQDGSFGAVISCLSGNALDPGPDLVQQQKILKVRECGFGYALYCTFEQGPARHDFLVRGVPQEQRESGFATVLDEFLYLGALELDGSLVAATLRLSGNQLDLGLDQAQQKGPMQKSGGFTADCKGNTPNAIFGVVIAQRGYAEHPATDYPKAEGQGFQGMLESGFVDEPHCLSRWTLRAASCAARSATSRRWGTAPFGLLPTLGFTQLVQGGFFLCCTSVRYFVRLRTEGERPSV